MTQEHTKEHGAVCEQCGYASEKTGAELFVDRRNHYIAHDLMESLDFSPALRAHVAYILHPERAPF